jgi:hypothetical protein
MANVGKLDSRTTAAASVWQRESQSRARIARPERRLLNALENHHRHRCACWRRLVVSASVRGHRTALRCSSYPCSDSACRTRSEFQQRSYNGRCENLGRFWRLPDGQTPLPISTARTHMRRLFLVSHRRSQLIRTGVERLRERATVSVAQTTQASTRTTQL